MSFLRVGGKGFLPARRFKMAQKNPRFKRGLKKLFLDFLVKRSAFERRIVLHLFNLLAVWLARVARSHIARRGFAFFACFCAFDDNDFSGHKFTFSV